MFSVTVIFAAIEGYEDITRKFAALFKMKAYARIVFDSCYLVTTFQELPDILPDMESYERVEHVWLTESEYEALPEFEGN